MKRILVVEDNPPFIKAMKMSFERIAQTSPIEIVFVETGREAIEALSQGTFDVLSVDGSFPGHVGGCVEGKAGLTLLANDCGSHLGYTIFYSNNDDQISAAAKLVVGGKPVQSHDKSALKLILWTALCIDLAAQSEAERKPA